MEPTPAAAYRDGPTSSIQLAPPRNAPSPAETEIAEMPGRQQQGQRAGQAQRHMGLAGQARPIHHIQQVAQVLLAQRPRRAVDGMRLAEIIGQGGVGFIAPSQGRRHLGGR